MDDIRLAIRRLVKRPASTLISVATLACAIGAAAATWSVLSAVLVDPLRVPSPERLVVLATESAGRRGPLTHTGFLYPAFHEIRDSGAFERTVAQWGGTHLLLVNLGSTPARTDVAFVTHDYFDVLGVPAILGREFLPDDDRRGASPVAVLTDRYWRQAFSADPSVVGRTIIVADKPVTIVGVLRPGFRGLNLAEKPDLYLAFHTIADVGGPTTNYFAERGHGSSPTSGMMIIGRLKPDGTGTEAAGRIAALQPRTGGARTARTIALPLHIAAIPAAARAGMERFSRLLAMTVALLLLVGCATVGMLLLIRTEARRSEFAMCMALGASRRRLARGIALEGGVLAVTGALFALPVAAWLFGLLQTFELPGDVSIELLELSLDRRVLGLCIAAAALALVLIAALAAGFGFRADVVDALRSRSGATPRLANRGTRTLLVAGQVAVAIVLVAGAGLFARSLIGALSLNTSLDMSRLVIGTIQLAPYGYTPERASEFFETLRRRLDGSPAVQRVAFSRWEGGMGAFGTLTINGQPRQFPSMVSYIRVDDDYFRTYGIRVTAGRSFGSDDRAGTLPVAITSESFGRMLAGGGSPLGSVLEGFSAADKPMTVVGVASDVITNVTVLEPLVIYLPVSQGRASPHRDLTVLAATDVSETRREILAAVRSLDARVSATALRTLDERITDQMGPQRLGGTVLGALGTIAVLLTLLGTYVLADAMASARMREMGIRAALGAQRRQLAAIVLAETARLVGVGIVAGLGLAWLSAGTIRAFLFQVQPLDPLTLTTVAAGILVLALSVSLRAALRVARVDLAQVLRAE